MSRYTALAVLMIVTVSPDAVAQADYILHNAHIYTVNRDQPIAGAMAVRGERILEVGSEHDILQAYPHVPRVDAGGRTVLPGLIDAHVHLMGLGIGMLQVDLAGTASIDEVVERLRAFERTLTRGAWLQGHGWDQNDWPGQAFPTRSDLDAAFPDRPVWLVRVDGHAAWANTAAIKFVGEEVLRVAPDPEGGKIVRDARGNPTGVFVDAAMGIVGQHIPPPGQEELEQALRLALRETARYGITSVHDAGIDLKMIDVYRRAIDEGWFHLRLYGMINGRGATLDHICEHGPIRDYGGRLVVRSVKYYIDGALGSRGAALLAAYSDDPGNSGLLFQSAERFVTDVQHAIECGLQVNTHAIGDRGVRVVLDAYERAMRNGNAGSGRHRIEHAQVVSLEDITRFARLGLIASMQPTHATSDMYWAEDRLGPERIRGAYAWRRFLDAGVTVPFGSDFPVEQVNPFLGFYAAVTRQDRSGWPEGGWYPDQRLTREEALRAFTLDAAYAAFQEDELGSLEPGKYADFIVLDRDVMTVPEAEIPEVKVIATYLSGKPVYGGL